MSGVFEDGLLILRQPGPPIISVEGIIYYRYMDQLYIPKVPALLDKDEVIAVSNARIKHAESLINVRYSLCVMRDLYENLLRVNAHKKVIDFGCGGGLLARLFGPGSDLEPPQSVFGVDLNPVAVDSALVAYAQIPNVREFKTSVFGEGDTLQLEDNSITGIFSSFVMHFKVFDSQLKELHRVLVPGGTFVWNDYLHSRYPGHSQKLIKKMSDIGFEVSKEKKEFRAPPENDIKHHMFFRAVKL
ncbi:class I SAM-dependent methyltransferase [Neptunomonas sp. XY-337]|uniref:class I SAM-dependent methyltransferase n=1 Tax=Neptunomonas sp. XY-337 TaxID=2561897 RepID=UPI0010AA6FD0|nr:class I SAM-dependent methyltransferase [Neptunomonas sp. XY-337]